MKTSTQKELLEAVKTIRTFIDSCDGGTSYIVTEDGERLCTDWEFFEQGMDEIEKYLTRRIENEQVNFSH